MDVVPVQRPIDLRPRKTLYFSLNPKAEKNKNTILVRKQQGKNSFLLLQGSVFYSLLVIFRFS